MSGYSLAAGVWIAKALAHWGIKLRLKWPNDLVFVPKGGGRFVKLGGILIEVLDNAPAAAVLVGVGINLLGSPSTVPHSSSLREAFGVSLTQEEVAEALGRELLAGHQEFMENGGFAPWVSRWSALSCFEDEFITMEVGAATVEGKFDGVSPSGALRLRSGEVVREIPSGHIVSWRT
jgi:BirA family biotin operon repressor/biotin-[acetyl-CoA-carboxylase] ligase